jgi:hypothetical protein
VRGWETSTLLGPSERANLNHWTTYVGIATDIYTPETRICQREVTGKCTIKMRKETDPFSETVCSSDFFSIPGEGKGAGIA